MCRQIFLYIYFQQTDLKSGDLNSVPKGAHELWTELKESLIKRPVLQGRYRSRFFVQAAHETTYESKVWIFKKLLHYERTSCHLTISSHQD